MVIVKRKIILSKVPMISALCHPKVRSLEAGLIEIFNAAIDIANPSTSVARWAVSVNMAIELAIYPPIHWQTIKKEDTMQTQMSLFIAVS
jgi:hypothetical protein